MPDILKDRVFENSTTTGLGNFTLTGAESSYQSFNAAYGFGGQTFPYVIECKTTGEWEVGSTDMVDATTLRRGGSQTVVASSNSNSPVNFSAGAKHVFSSGHSDFIQAYVDDAAASAAAALTSENNAETAETNAAASASSASTSASTATTQASNAAASAVLSAAAAGFAYKFSTDTTSSDPTTGYLKVNNAVLSAATALYIHETTNDSQAIAALLATLDDSTSTIKTKARLFKQSDPTVYAIFNITGTITDNGSWDTFTIAYVSGNGSFSNNDILTTQFLITGDKGTTGDTGPTGSIPIADAGGTADAITANFTPDLTLTDKTLCVVVALGPNTISNPTFAPDGVTAYNIVTRGGTALVPGDIAGAGHACIFEYNSANTRWELLNPATATIKAASVTASMLVAPAALLSGGTVGGTANAITLTPTPALGAYAANDTRIFLPPATNTSGVVTVAVSALATRNIKKSIGGALVILAVGDLVINIPALIWDDGTQYVLLNPQTFTQGADVASATTTNLDTATGNYVHITGTTAITGITLSQGRECKVVFDGALTFTNGASLILPGGANITTAAGDTATLRGEASGVVRCLNYTVKAAVPFSVSSTDNAISRYDGTSGKQQNSGVFIDDSNGLYGYTGVFNDQTGTTYTTVDGDTGKIVSFSNASAITVTLENSSPKGTAFTWYAKGAGQITFAAEAGGSLVNRQSHTKSAGQYAGGTLFVESNTGTNAKWVLLGDTAA